MGDVRTFIDDSDGKVTYIFRRRRHLFGFFLNNYPSILLQEKPCLAACNDQVPYSGRHRNHLLSGISFSFTQKYHVLVTQSSYPNEHTFRQTPQFCVLVEKLKRSCKGSRR